MLTKNEDGQYVVCMGKYVHKKPTLAWVLLNDSLWLIEACCKTSDIAGRNIVDAAFVMQELGMDPESDEFWAAVDAIVDEGWVAGAL